ncbi:hypothetical protein LJR164_000981 [Phenylobacterium sp. LjRoot164]
MDDAGCSGGDLLDDDLTILAVVRMTAKRSPSGDIAAASMLGSLP